MGFSCVMEVDARVFDCNAHALYIGLSQVAANMNNISGRQTCLINRQIIGD